jgi:P27 family predicted phage terminase small subunit
MGIRGRRPRPSHLRILDGTAASIPADEPQPVGDLQEPPEWFNDSQRATWRYALEHAPPGLLKKCDKAILAIWVCAEDVHAEAAHMVGEKGAVLRAPKSGVPMVNPYLAVMNKQALLMLKAASELGFSPTGRTRVKVDPNAGKRNAFDDLKSLDDNAE